MSLNVADHAGLRSGAIFPADAARKVYSVKVDHPDFQYILHVSTTIEAMTRTISQIKDMAFHDVGYF